jgi:hypothetical protein
MKSLLVFSLSLMTLNTLAWTVTTETKCGSPNGNSSFSGSTDGEIQKINSLIIKMDQSSTPRIELNLSAIRMIDAANNDNRAKNFNELYSVKEMKSGTMFELKGHEQNTFNLDAVFLEYGNLDVLTAGPIPEGTYNQTISLAVIDSNIFYTNPSPMTVKKFVFECKTSFKYNN